jgi:hypothetical protein
LPTACIGEKAKSRTRIVCQSPTEDWQDIDTIAFKDQFIEGDLFGDLIQNDGQDTES